MSIATTVELDRGTLVIRTSFLLKDVCREIPGRVWDPDRRAWLAQGSPDVALAVSQLFGKSAQFLNGAEVLLENGRAQAAARRMKADEGEPPPVPGTKTAPWRHQARAYWFVRRIWGDI